MKAIAITASIGWYLFGLLTYILLGFGVGLLVLILAEALRLIGALTFGG